MRLKRIHYILIVVISFQLIYSNRVFCQEIGFDQWPVLRSYEDCHTDKVSMPLGGIGTGVVYLSGRGELRDWSIMNRPGFGYNPFPSFFCIYAKQKGKAPVTRVLEGQIEDEYYIGTQGATSKNAGLPRFDSYRFDAAYPFARVHLLDDELPVKVKLMAFNPMIPVDVDASGIPIAVLRYLVTNDSDREVDVSICGNLVNFIGNDGLFGKEKGNRNTYLKEGSLQGIYFSSDSLNECSEQYGSMALTTSSENEVSYRTNWMKSTLWFNTDVLDFWNDFSEDGTLNERNSIVDSPIASLSVEKTIAPKDSADFEFYLTWHFPNRNKWGWQEVEYPDDCNSSHHIGNYYTSQYTDAWDVADKTIDKLTELEHKSKEFVNTLLKSDFPEAVKEAALFNLSNLRSQTFFRDWSGRMFAYEGQLEHMGGWPGNCTHVLNYEQAIPFLFGRLSKSFRYTEYMYATDSTGKMAFRVHLPLSKKSSEGIAAADGQMGCLMKLYRDWQLSGNDTMLIELWPKAKKTLEFAWIDGGWDANQDGVMEGCQHNTMDVDYFGPNPQMGIWYLGALKASEKMADYIGDSDISNKCDRLYESGREWMDKNLFNGEYYEQRIIPPKMKVLPELYMHNDIYGSDFKQFQLADGCLVDQMVGQFMAHICGLGYLVDKEHIKKTLQSILKYNSVDFGEHFNNMRAYGLDGEKGMIMASYPKGLGDRLPFPYFNEAMSGFEYSTAVHMIYEGMVDEGVDCFTNIRNRFNGENRNPFNEFEAGYHYNRAMASWAAIPALSGFHYSGVDGTMTFGNKPGFYFWSNGYAWGSCRIEGNRVELKVMYGELFLKKFILTGIGSKKFKDLTLTEDESLIIEI